MIRIAEEKDIDGILNVQRRAFHEEDEAELVLCILGDQTAQPTLSMVAEKDDQIVGHILFSRAEIEGASAYLLAPLAVHPDYQFKGIGRRLIKAGLEQLDQWQVDLVFVLGDPEYYPRAGFEPNAIKRGLLTPHPIPEEHHEAWMVQELCFGVLGRIKGTLKVCDAISPADYWS